MFKNYIDWLRENQVIILFLLVIVFVLIRLPGIHLPLHQDEYKWPLIVNPDHISETSIPHPPLSQFIYRTGGMIVGFNTNFRYIPLFFGVLNLLLLYYLVRFLFGKKEALVACVLWSVSYFSVLSSLMVDTDGEVMPFFFLLSLVGYFKFINVNGREKYKWLSLLLTACILGFLVKVSFLIAIGAILADYIWSKKGSLSRKDYVMYSVYGMLGIICLAILLVLVKFIFPFFDLSGSIKYWEHFAVGNRNWFQTAIQCIKAVLYSSPLLIIIPFWGDREIFKKTKVFIFFLIFSFIFYVVLFDFSLGALDRYLQLLVLPLVVISALVISKNLSLENRRMKEFVLLGVTTSIVLIVLQSVPHFVPPLHPKSLWIDRVIHLKWNFLYPFSGGSGPLGFYVSFLFIVLSWIISFFAIIVSKLKANLRTLVLIFILPICFTYNFIFIEEYLFGFWNGYAPGLLSGAVDFIKSDPDIKFVTTYNDNGGNELQEIGKYRKRLYIDPKFDINEKVLSLNKYKEHYFVLNVPRIDPNTIYQKYFDSCVVVYNKIDRNMSAILYDCRGAPDIKI